VTERRHIEPTPLGGGADGLPYSKGVMTRTLMAAGVSATRAYELARAIERDLERAARQSVELERVQELAVEVLGEEAGTVALQRLRRHLELQACELPIVVLIGGATGSGKSRVATEVAHRLGVTRVTSTDFIRQTMRAFFSAEFMPSIHYSSFEAGHSLAGDWPDRLVGGFLDQTRNVLVGVRAALDRALHEGLSMVIEGVHLVPGMLPTELERTVLVQCVLAIDDEDEHARHFWIRDATSEGTRPLEKYLESFGDIRRLQGFIVDRARDVGVPVIENANLERAIAEVMALVHGAAERAEVKTV
jgi:2-phosphoglycerate kinase